MSRPRNKTLATNHPYSRPWLSVSLSPAHRPASLMLALLLTLLLISMLLFRRALRPPVILLYDQLIQDDDDRDGDEREQDQGKHDMNTSEALFLLGSAESIDLSHKESVS